MREISFRGKRADDGEWVEGSLTVNHYDRAGKIEDEYRIVDTYYGLDDEDLPTYQSGLDETVVPSTVGQYTGMTDKHGTQIFEGDILRVAKKMDGRGHYHFPPAPFPALCIVKWDLCAWMWEVHGKETYYIHFPDAWCHYECEIVGNVHDNAELLEADA